MKALMVSAYIFFCICRATRPCKYFQLNARHFDAATGVFSKIALDELLPASMRLAQYYDDGASCPSVWPVFVKPEWSQNARGVHRADDFAALSRIRRAYRGVRGRRIIQQAAPGAREYEIFSIVSENDSPAVLTVTEARNDCETLPVNSVYNRNTRYVELTDSLDDLQRARIWRCMRSIGAFPISRVSVRADSLDALQRAAFHVIEVNLFLPMPINLLDQTISRPRAWLRAIGYMNHLARATQHRDRSVGELPVFLGSMLYNRRGKLSAWAHRRLTTRAARRQAKAQANDSAK